MANEFYEKIGKAVDATALQYKELSNKSALTHREEMLRADCLSKIGDLLLKYSIKQNRNRNIYQNNDNDTDNLELWRIIKRTLEIFIQNEQKTYFNLFCTYYQKRINTIMKKYIDEDRQTSKNEASISDENARQILIETEEYNKKYNNTSSFEGIWDEILKITHENALKQSEKFAEYIKGYWTIKFVEEKIGQKQANLWKIYILLLFFLKYEKDNKKHGELMDLMAEEFGLKRRAWHNHYKDAFDFICRSVRHLNIIKRGTL